MDQVLIDCELPDPFNDRKLSKNECPTLMNRPIQNDILFNKNKLPDWKMLKEFLKYEGHITKEQCVTILKTV